MDGIFNGWHAKQNWIALLSFHILLNYLIKVTNNWNRIPCRQRFEVECSVFIWNRRKCRMHSYKCADVIVLFAAIIIMINIIRMDERTFNLMKMLMRFKSTLSSCHWIPLHNSDDCLCFFHSSFFLLLLHSALYWLSFNHAEYPSFYYVCFPFVDIEILYGCFAVTKSFNFEIVTTNWSLIRNDIVMQS